MLTGLKSMLAKKLLTRTNKPVPQPAARLGRSVNREFTPLSDTDARTLLHTVPWYHRFELRPGLMTPGTSDCHPSAVCDFLGVPQDLAGCRALDIGSWDGPLAFELERRGAEVVALDIQDPTRVGFAVARRILCSRVVHVRATVYDLPRLDVGTFDHIVFKGVYYHLKYPLLAFEAIARCLKFGGRVYFEGEAPLNHVEDLDGRRVTVDLSELDELNVPVCLSYPNRFKGGSNWFIPNRACVESWLRASGMTLVSHKYWESDAQPFGGQRLIGVAKKTSEHSEETEHPIM